MQTAKVTIHFGKGYIGHPYTRAVLDLVNIEKASGMNRARSDTNRRQALEQYLKSVGLTVSDYETLKEEAARPFYYLNGPGSEIIIPAKHIESCLVEASHAAKSSIRLCPPDKLRTALSVSDFLTGKTEPDGTWWRTVVVTGAQGKLSNQRGERENAYIEDFDATGTIAYSEAMVEPKKLHQFLQFAGSDVGTGASRKMGWGRFTVTEFTII
jgi:hypothetical protein